MGLGTNEILQRAIVLHRQDDLFEAEQLYKVVVDAEPTNAVAHHNLGLIAVHNKQYDQAISLFKIAKKIQNITGCKIILKNQKIYIKEPKINISKIKKEFNFKIKKNLIDDIESLVNKFKLNHANKL